MSEKKDPNDPSNTSGAYDAMAPVWNKIQTVLNGTEAMRAAAETYLPMHDNEAQDSYDERLVGNVLRNIASQTLESWVGRPFGNDITINEDVPDVMIPHLSNIDRCGDDVHVYARGWLREGLAKGAVGTFVDYPRTSRPADAPPRTQEDDIREGVRPYWVRLTPENVLAAYSEIRNGVEVLTHVRIREDYTVRVGFVETMQRQIRVLDLIDIFERPDDVDSPLVPRMRVQVWQEKIVGKGRKPKWVVDSEWITGIDEIPVAIFYAGERCAPMIGKPPIEDLVDLNIRYWQSNSDQISILTVTRFPILALSGGAPEDDDLVIGPRNWLYCSDARGRFYYVEHGGAAISAGKDDLADLIEQMADYGAEFLKRRPTNTPATSRILDSDESMSQLQDAVIRFSAALNRAMALHAKWMRLAEGGTITVETDFGPNSEESNIISAVQAMRKERDLSRENYLKRMKELGVLPDSFDLEENEAQLADERQEMATPSMPIDENAPPDNAPPQDNSGNQGA